MVRVAEPESDRNPAAVARATAKRLGAGLVKRAADLELERSTSKSTLPRPHQHHHSGRTSANHSGTASPSSSHVGDAAAAASTARSRNSSRTHNASSKRQHQHRQQSHRGRNRDFIVATGSVAGTPTSRAGDTHDSRGSHGRPRTQHQHQNQHHHQQRHQSPLLDREYSAGELAADAGLRLLTSVWHKLQLADAIVRQAALLDRTAGGGGGGGGGSVGGVGRVGGDVPIGVGRAHRTAADRQREVLQLERAKLVLLVGRKFNLEETLEEVLGAMAASEAAQARQRRRMDDAGATSPAGGGLDTTNTSGGGGGAEGVATAAERVRHLRQLNSSFLSKHNTSGEDLSLLSLRRLVEGVDALAADTARLVPGEDLAERRQTQASARGAVSNYRDIVWLIEAVDLAMLSDPDHHEPPPPLSQPVAPAVAVVTLEVFTSKRVRRAEQPTPIAAAAAAEVEEAASTAAGADNDESMGRSSRRSSGGVSGTGELGASGGTTTTTHSPDSASRPPVAAPSTATKKQPQHTTFEEQLTRTRFSDASMTLIPLYAEPSVVSFSVLGDEDVLSSAAAATDVAVTAAPAPAPPAPPSTEVQESAVAAAVAQVRKATDGLTMLGFMLEAIPDSYHAAFAAGGGGGGPMRPARRHGSGGGGGALPGKARGHASSAAAAASRGAGSRPASGAVDGGAGGLRPHSKRSQHSAESATTRDSKNRHRHHRSASQEESNGSGGGGSSGQSSPSGGEGGLRGIASAAAAAVLAPPGDSFFSGAHTSSGGGSHTAAPPPRVLLPIRSGLIADLRRLYPTFDVDEFINARRANGGGAGGHEAEESLIAEMEAALLRRRAAAAARAAAAGGDDDGGEVAAALKSLTLARARNNTGAGGAASPNRTASGGRRGPDLPFPQSAGLLGGGASRPTSGEAAASFVEAGEETKGEGDEDGPSERILYDESLPCGLRCVVVGKTADDDEREAAATGGAAAIAGMKHKNKPRKAGGSSKKKSKSKSKTKPDGSAAEAEGGEEKEEFTRYVVLVTNNHSDSAAVATVRLLSNRLSGVAVSVDPGMASVRPFIKSPVLNPGERVVVATLFPTTAKTRRSEAVPFTQAIDFEGELTSGFDAFNLLQPGLGGGIGGASGSGRGRGRGNHGGRGNNADGDDMLSLVSSSSSGHARPGRVGAKALLASVSNAALTAAALAKQGPVLPKLGPGKGVVAGGPATAATAAEQSSSSPSEGKKGKGDGAAAKSSIQSYVFPPPEPGDEGNTAETEAVENNLVALTVLQLAAATAGGDTPDGDDAGGAGGGQWPGGEEKDPAAVAAAVDALIGRLNSGAREVAHTMLHQILEEEGIAPEELKGLVPAEIEELLLSARSEGMGNEEARKSFTADGTAAGSVGEDSLFCSATAIRPHREPAAGDQLPDIIPSAAVDASPIDGSSSPLTGLSRGSSDGLIGLGEVAATMAGVLRPTSASQASSWPTPVSQGSRPTSASNVSRPASAALLLRTSVTMGASLSEMLLRHGSRRSGFFPQAAVLAAAASDGSSRPLLAEEAASYLELTVAAHSDKWAERTNDVVEGEEEEGVEVGSHGGQGSEVFSGVPPPVVHPVVLLPPPGCYTSRTPGTARLNVLVPDDFAAADIIGRMFGPTSTSESASSTAAAAGGDGRGGLSSAASRTGTGEDPATAHMTAPQRTAHSVAGLMQSVAAKNAAAVAAAAAKAASAGGGGGGKGRRSDMGVGAASTAAVARTEMDVLSAEARLLYLEDPLRYEAVMDDLVRLTSAELGDIMDGESASSSGGGGGGGGRPGSKQGGLLGAIGTESLLAVMKAYHEALALEGATAAAAAGGGGGADGLGPTVPGNSMLSSLIPRPGQDGDDDGEGRRVSFALGGDGGVPRDGTAAAAAGVSYRVYGDDDPRRRTTDGDSGNNDFAAGSGDARRHSPSGSPRHVVVITEADGADAEARLHGLGTAEDGAAEIEKILYEQLKAKLLMRLIIGHMNTLWARKGVELHEKARAALDRTIASAADLSWMVARRRMGHVAKLIHLLDRRTGRVRGFIPFYRDDNVLVDTGRDNSNISDTVGHCCPRYLHYHEPALALAAGDRYLSGVQLWKLHHAMCLAKQRRLMPLRVVRVPSQPDRSNGGRHMLFGYRKHVVLLDTAPDHSLGNTAHDKATTSFAEGVVVRTRQRQTLLTMCEQPPPVERSRRRLAVPSATLSVLELRAGVNCSSPRGPLGHEDWALPSIPQLMRERKQEQREQQQQR